MFLVWACGPPYEFHNIGCFVIRRAAGGGRGARGPSQAVDKSHWFPLDHRRRAAVRNAMEIEVRERNAQIKHTLTLSLLSFLS